MEKDENRIFRVDNPQDGPSDGVILLTECIRTDFVEKPVEGEQPFTQSDKGDASLAASVEIGTFSIRDRVSGVMLTVPLNDVMEVMVAVLDNHKKEGIES